MAITIDPQEREVRVFDRLARWHGRRVLEIGCGDGRLTRRLARLGARVVAIDPDANQVRAARAFLTRSPTQRIEYRVGRAERLPCRARDFDSVVFSWALWWVAEKGMVHALCEVHRVLRTGGTLVDLRPAAKHRRVGLGRGRRWRQIGVMRESFEKDRAADRAVAEALRANLFRRGARIEFLVEREMDTMDDFLAWLKDFGQRRTLASHEWLVRKLKRALAVREAPIVGRGLVTIQLLRKME